MKSKRTKEQKNKKAFFLMCIFFSVLSLGMTSNFSKAANFDPAGEARCLASGGTSFTLGRCYGCPEGTTGNVSGVCQNNADYNAQQNTMDYAAEAHPDIAAGTGSIYTTKSTSAGGATKNTAEFKYKLLESFPGFFKEGDVLTDFPAMILAIYKFGIWTVGIAGFFMLVVGGFMYMASAGNTSTAGNARGIIWDALLGIVAALGAYLILYVINPELTKINISFTQVDVTETLGYGVGGGTCKVPTTGPCTVENLQKTCFGSNATAAAMVCGYESGGNAGSASKSDIGADGNVFSWGLFQINLTQHSLNGVDCPTAFVGKNYASKVTDSAKYGNCKTIATTAMTNINYACKISNNGTNWKPWINTKKACNL